MWVVFNAQNLWGWISNLEKVEMKLLQNAPDTWGYQVSKAMKVFSSTHQNVSP